MVVSDVEIQNDVVKKIKEVFSTTTVVDRRIHPSYGYRAVHVIIKHKEKAIEVQIRTELQHGWAEFSEKLSDKIDSSIKYGGGSKKIQRMLLNISKIIKLFENQRTKINPQTTKRISQSIAKIINNYSKLIFDYGE